MKKRLLTCLTVLTLSMASSMSVLAAPEIMSDGGVFDAEYYARSNPDVVAVLGTDKDALYSHYVNNGKAEGRQGLSPETGNLDLPFFSKERVEEIINTGGNFSHRDYVIFITSAMRYGLADQLYNPCGLTFKYMYKRDKESDDRWYPDEAYESLDSYMGYYIYNESNGEYANNLDDIYTLFAIKAQAKIKEDEIEFMNMNVPMDEVEEAAWKCQDMLAFHYGAEIEELKVYKQYASYIIEFKIKYAE